jgi:hypothetical protein
MKSVSIRGAGRNTLDMAAVVEPKYYVCVIVMFFRTQRKRTSGTINVQESN